jgi:hypothetical protein
VKSAAVPGVPLPIAAGFPPGITRRPPGEALLTMENRLGADELARLAPGDTVVVEVSGDFRRPRHTTGTIVRLEGSSIVVCERSARGVPYVHRYSRRDGQRIGGGRRAELVRPDSAAALAESDEPTRRALRIDAAYRDWSRHRGDLARLQRLHAAITQCLEEVGQAPSRH